ncbi:hypothetical protein SAT01_39660 [Sinomonas atrocyanea]|nr:hypothetical protein SAT01_39660 [Sinomonas atrocyanea]GGG71851.1 hypothetical protein GCM10007172_25240 [Sinomonas atrocyanea]
MPPTARVPAASAPAASLLVTSAVKNDKVFLLGLGVDIDPPSRQVGREGPAVSTDPVLRG